MSDDYDIDQLLRELFPEGLEAAFSEDTPAEDAGETVQDALGGDGQPSRQAKQPVMPASPQEPKQPIAPRPAREAKRPIAPRSAQEPKQPTIASPVEDPTQLYPTSSPEPEQPDRTAVQQPGADPVNESDQDEVQQEATRTIPVIPSRAPSAPADGHRGLLAAFSRADHHKRHAENMGRLDELVRARDAQELGDEIEERDFRPIRQRRDGRTGLLGGLMYAAFVICLSVILACVAWMAASDVLALNKEDLSAQVTLPKDIFYEKEVDVEDEDGNVTGTKTVQAADMKRVSRILKDAGIIEYRRLFEIYANISHADQKVDPGTYELTTDYDYRALIKKMTIGSEAMVVTTVTIPEGYSVDQIFQKLEDNNICSKEDLYEAAANYNYNYSFLSDVPENDPLRLEGFLFPDTYEFYQGEQASNAINRFLLNFHYKLTADMLTQASDLGLTLREAVTVASMIEKEAGNDDERALIASVIYNRLEAGMPLQIDATVLYALGDWSATIDASAKAYNSPYNTYLFAGLPAGPICNPGMASLKAALQPADTDYLYYALDTEAGEHRFFTNYDEFTAFTATQNYG